MSDDVEDTPTMADRLNATGSKLAELSKKAVAATKVAAQKTAEVSIDAAQSATKASKNACLLYTSPSPRDRTRSRMPSSA